MCVHAPVDNVVVVIVVVVSFIVICMVFDCVVDVDVCITSNIQPTCNYLPTVFDVFSKYSGTWKSSYMLFVFCG